MAGAFFVAVAVVAVVAVWLTSTTTGGRPWVVASRDLPAGAQLDAADLTTESLTLPASGIAALAFSRPAELVGRVLAAPVDAGELLQTGDVAAPRSEGLRPVTVAVATSDLTDLGSGSLVDVLVTDGTDPSSPTDVVVGDARVLALGHASDSLVAGDSGGEVTLGVATLAQVTAVVHAAHTGTLSVVVGAPGDDAAVTAPGAAPTAAAPTPTPTKSTPKPASPKKATPARAKPAKVPARAKAKPAPTASAGHAGG